jgi:hypothetical protein
MCPDMVRNPDRRIIDVKKQHAGVSALCGDNHENGEQVQERKRHSRKQDRLYTLEAHAA